MPGGFIGFCFVLGACCHRLGPTSLGGGGGGNRERERVVAGRRGVCAFCVRVCVLGGGVVLVVCCARAGGVLAARAALAVACVSGCVAEPGAGRESREGGRGGGGRRRGRKGGRGGRGGARAVAQGCARFACASALEREGVALVVCCMGWGCVARVCVCFAGARACQSAWGLCACAAWAEGEGEGEGYG